MSDPVKLTVTLRPDVADELRAAAKMSPTPGATPEAILAALATDWAGRVKKDRERETDTMERGER